MVIHFDSPLSNYCKNLFIMYVCVNVQLGCYKGGCGTIDTSRGAYSSYANKLDGSKQTAMQIDAL